MMAQGSTQNAQFLTVGSECDVCSSSGQGSLSWCWSQNACATVAVVCVLFAGAFVCTAAPESNKYLTQARACPGSPGSSHTGRLADGSSIGHPQIGRGPCIALKIGAMRGGSYSISRTAIRRCPVPALHGRRTASAQRAWRREVAHSRERPAAAGAAPSCADALPHTGRYMARPESDAVAVGRRCRRAPRLGRRWHSALTLAQAAARERSSLWATIEGNGVCAFAGSRLAAEAAHAAHPAVLTCSRHARATLAQHSRLR